MSAPLPRFLRRLVQLLAAAAFLFALAVTLAVPLAAILAATLAATPRASAEEPEADVEALRESLERDRARLIELVSQPSSRDGQTTADDAELREIAERMPRTQEALRAQTAKSADGPRTGTVDE